MIEHLLSTVEMMIMPVMLKPVKNLSTANIVYDVENALAVANNNAVT